MPFFNESNDFVKNNQDNDFIDKKLLNVNGITVYRNPNSHNKLTRKIYVDDRIGVDNILRFNQTLENHLKVSFRNDVSNLIKQDKKQFTDTTIIKYLKSGGYLLQKWVIKSNDRNIIGKNQNVIKLTKTNSPTIITGATGLPLLVILSSI